MSSRKSSITAEIKLAGQAKFKSDLAGINTAAQKTGRTIAGIQAVPASMLGSGYNEARRKVEEAQRSHHRVLQRDAAKNAERLRFYNSVGVGTGRGGRSGGGGLGAGSKLAVGYNAVQDLVQGGPSAIANNIPQIIEMVSRSPALKLLGAAAVAAGAAYMAVSAYQYAASSTEKGNDKLAFDRYGKNKEESVRKEAKRLAEEASQAAAKRGQSAGDRHSKFGSAVDQEIAGITIGAEMMTEVRTQHQELRRLRLDSIEDPADRARALAEEEKRALDENLTARRQLAAAMLEISSREEEASVARIRAINDELNAQTKASKTPEDLNREVELKGELAGLEERIAQARVRSSKATEEINSVKNAERVANVQKMMIDERTNADLETIKRQKDADALEGDQARDQQVREINRERKQIEKKLETDKKDKQAIRDSLAADEAKAKMSPRKRAKAEEAEQIEAEKQDLISKGFSPEEAGKMAERSGKLRKNAATDEDRASRGLRRRIRGAGFQEEDKGFGGIDGVEYNRLQPREDVKGKRSRNQDMGGSGNENLGTIMFRGFAQMIAAIKENGPSRNERSKPLSSSRR